VTFPHRPPPLLPSSPLPPFPPSPLPPLPPPPSSLLAHARPSVYRFLSCHRRVCVPCFVRGESALFLLCLDVVGTQRRFPFFQIPANINGFGPVHCTQGCRSTKYCILYGDGGQGWGLGPTGQTHACMEEGGQEGLEREGEWKKKKKQKYRVRVWNIREKVGGADVSWRCAQATARCLHGWALPQGPLH
jgi:hypothetical protein